MLEQCNINIKPYDDFWKAYSEVTERESEWMKTPICQLDADEVQGRFKKLMAAMGRMEVTFKEKKNKKLTDIATNRKKFLTSFQKKIPVIRALTTKGLEPAHIAKMAKKVGQSGDITKNALETMPDIEGHIQFLEGEADFAFR